MIISRCARFTDGFMDDEMLSIVNAVEGRPTYDCWMPLLLFKESNSRGSKALDRLT